MKVVVTPKALRQYNHLPKIEREKIKKKLSSLEQDSFLGKKLTGKYAHLRSLKAWPYRIIYFIDTKRREVWIVSVLHRQGAYT